MYKMSKLKAKFIVFLIGAAMIISFAACGQDDDDSQNANQTTAGQSVTASAPTGGEPTDTATFPTEPTVPSYPTIPTVPTDAYQQGQQEDDAVKQVKTAIGSYTVQTHGHWGSVVIEDSFFASRTGTGEEEANMIIGALDFLQLAITLREDDVTAITDSVVDSFFETLISYYNSEEYETVSLNRNAKAGGYDATRLHILVDDTESGGKATLIFYVVTDEAGLYLISYMGETNAGFIAEFEEMTESFKKG
jgi:hypothetical protein